MMALFEMLLRFLGQYYDKETDTHDDYFRDYNPSIGRYLQSDLIGLTGRLNIYAYALGNPIIYTDPLGLDVMITMNRVGSTSTSVSGTMNVNSTATNQTFSSHTLESLNPPNSSLPVTAGTYDVFVRTDH